MKALTLYHLARADVLERARRYSFLVTLAGTVYVGWLVNAGYVNMAAAGQRGVLNSAWVGTLMAIFAATMLPLAGFYLVKNTLERDRSTGVGEILATTPVSRLAYVLGKAASNFALLLVIVALLAVAGALMQLLSGEDRRLDLAAFLAPLAGLALPPLAIVAATAVLFETVRWLRGTLGNVVYFFLWAFALGAAFNSPALDPAGLVAVKASMHRQLAGAGPVDPQSYSFTIGPRPEATTATFRWEGLDWTGEVVAQRLAVVAAAFAIALLAALLFGRFDPAREGRRPAAPAPGQGPAGAPGRRRWRIPLPAVATRSPFAALVVAELRLMLQGRHRFWYLAALGLLVAGAVAPLAAARTVVLSIAWIWPIALWSGMGARETCFGTRQLVFSGPLPVGVHAAAIWAAGVLVAAATGAGVGLRLALAGDGAGLLAWLAGCLFVPSLALALGAWSGSTKPFEVIYLVLWYIGPMNRVPTFDYLGATEDAMPIVYLALAATLLAAAIAGRGRQARA